MAVDEAPSSAPGAPETVWVFWDGECGLCRRFADWARDNDRHGRLRIIPFQDAPSPPMTPQIYEACADAVHVITPSGRVYRAGDAVLVILGILGWKNLARVFRRRPFIWGIEIGYRWVAGHRPFVARMLWG